jgi:hypothetical protein
MAKIDFKKALKDLYSASAKATTIVDVPEMNFLMIDGEGDPNTSQTFQEAVEALYSISYTLKFMIKNCTLGDDYVVMPLEGLWWTNDRAEFSRDNKGLWKWTVMIMQPQWATRELVDKALEKVKEKKNLPALHKIRFDAFAEGLSAQIMHMGPFSAEGPTIEKLHSFIKERGHVLREKHHEIYLSHPHRTAVEKLKTIIKQAIN